jgi:MFS transporter, DHA2 family, multidrug resistance protein
VLLTLAGLVAGAGWGIFQTPNNRELMGSGPPEKSGSTAAIFASIRVAGQTCGASLAAIVFAALAPSVGAHIALDALRTAVIAALALACALSVLAMLLSGQRAFRDGFHYHPA